jgi:hypothetical protein
LQTRQAFLGWLTARSLDRRLLSSVCPVTHQPDFQGISGILHSLIGSLIQLVNIMVIELVFSCGTSKYSTSLAMKPSKALRTSPSKPGTLPRCALCTHLDLRRLVLQIVSVGLLVELVKLRRRQTLAS